MKSLVESYISIIIYVFFVFTCIGFSSLQFQLLQARHVHTAIVNQVQCSYYQVDLNALNTYVQKQINPSWHVSLVGDDNNPVVQLDYNVVLPVFNIERNGILQGYVR